MLPRGSPYLWQVCDKLVYVGFSRSSYDFFHRNFSGVVSVGNILGETPGGEDWKGLCAQIILLASSFKMNWESLPKRDPPIEKHRLLGHNAELASNPGHIEGLNRRVSQCFARSIWVPGGRAAPEWSLQRQGHRIFAGEKCRLTFHSRKAQQVPQIALFLPRGWNFSAPANWREKINEYSLDNPSQIKIRQIPAWIVLFANCCNKSFFRSCPTGSFFRNLSQRITISSWLCTFTVGRVG